MRTQWLFIIGLLAITQALSVAADDPKTTLEKYFTSLKAGDSTNASKFMAKFSNYDDAHVAFAISQLLSGIRRSGRVPAIRDQKTDEDCAVVVLYESPTDPDPAYLLKQDGTWRVLPELSRFDQDGLGLEEAQLERFRELEAWYRIRVGKATPPALAPFTEAILKDPAKLTKHLDDGLDPNARSPDAYAEPLLWRAVRLRQAAAVELLLDRGARVDERSASFKKTALFQAAFDGSYEIAQLLLKRGANPNATDSSGNNALRDAILAKRTDLARLLRDSGANPDQVNSDGESMRLIAQQHGNPAIKAILAGDAGIQRKE